MEPPFFGAGADEADTSRLGSVEAFEGPAAVS